MSTPANRDHTATDRLSQSAHESVDQVAKTAGRAEKSIRHAASNVEAHVRDAGLRAKKRSDKTLKSLGIFVRENPMTALGCAFAAGTLLAALRRRS